MKEGWGQEGQDKNPLKVPGPSPPLEELPTTLFLPRSLLVPQRLGLGCGSQTSALQGGRTFWAF